MEIEGQPPEEQWKLLLGLRERVRQATWRDAALMYVDSIDTAWGSASLSVPPARRSRFVGLSAAQARSLEDACLRWLRTSDKGTILSNDWQCCIARPRCQKPDKLGFHSGHDGNRPYHGLMYGCIQCNRFVCSSCSGRLCITRGDDGELWFEALCLLQGSKDGDPDKDDPEGSMHEGVDFSVPDREWVVQPRPPPPPCYDVTLCCDWDDVDGCSCWRCRWDGGAAAAYERERAEVRSREDAQRSVRALKPEVSECVMMARGRALLKRRCEEAFTKLTPTARALAHAEDARKGTLAELSSAERRFRARRSPLVASLQAMARQRRVQVLTQRLTAERAASNGAESMPAESALPVDALDFVRRE